MTAPRFHREISPGLTIELDDDNNVVIRTTGPVQVVADANVMADYLRLAATFADIFKKREAPHA